MQRWTLTSSSGRNEFTGVFLRHWNDEIRSLLLLAEITVQGMFWPRGQEMSGTELVTDYAVTLPQVIVQKDAIDRLIAELTNWSNRPKQFSVDLASSKNNDQALKIFFGVSDSLISSVEKPACVLMYTNGAFIRGEWSFVVDQSCINNFLSSLVKARAEWKS